MQLTVDEFFDLTPIEFHFALSEHETEKDQERRFHMETMRIQTLYLVNIHLPRNKFIKDPKKLMSFGWDEKEKTMTVKPEILTEEQWIELDERLDKIWNKKKETAH